MIRPTVRDKLLPDALRQGLLQSVLVFALSAARVGGIYAPWALAAAAVSGGKSRGLWALLGAGVGALVFFDFQTGLRFAASAVLIYSANMAFCDTKMYARKGFAPLLAALALLLVQSVYLVGRSAAQWALGVSASAVAAAVACGLDESRENGRLHLLVVMTAAAAALSAVQVEGFSPGSMTAAWLALLCAFACGMLAGFVTGMFHTKCGIPAILSGILTQLALYSINLRIMDSKANQAVGVDKYPLMVSQRYVRELSLKNPLPILLLFTFAVIALLYWFFGTERGCAIRATGANQNMARAQGINTNANVVFGLMLSNGLVALSGALLAQFQGAADVNMGRGAIVIGLAAVIIGEVIFGKLFTNFGLKLFAVSIGAVIYYFVLQIVLQLGLNTNDLKLITALIVALFLAIPYWKSKMFHGKTKKEETRHA